MSKYFNTTDKSKDKWADRHNWKNYEEPNGASDKKTISNWKGNGIGRKATITRRKLHFSAHRPGLPSIEIINCIIVGYIESKSKPREYIALKYYTEATLTPRYSSLWRDINSINSSGKHYIISKKKFNELCETFSVSTIINHPANDFEIIPLKENYLSSNFLGLYN